MKLKKVRITNFQSITDSNEIKIDEITCLVGKNEAGKTAILKALYKLNPINVSDDKFNETLEYPRPDYARYRRAVRNDEEERAQVVEATYEFEDDDLESLELAFGPNCFDEDDPEITLSKGYSNEIVVHDMDIFEVGVIRHLITESNPSSKSTPLLMDCETAEEVLNAIEHLDDSDSLNDLAESMSRIIEDGISVYIFDEIISDLLPKFLYFDEYYQISGQTNLDSFVERVTNNQQDSSQYHLLPSDFPLLGLLKLSDIELEDLLNPESTQELTAYLEAAESILTSECLPFWSQNKNIRMKFDVRRALLGDPEGMQTGTNFWGQVVNTTYNSTTPISTRSRGFIWFFSFMAWYSYVRETEEDIIFLLDEPGLSLHAKAQADLLHFFEQRLRPDHQLIYTTHSPFMIDPSRLHQTRIVQDLSIEPRSEELEADQKGTRVTTDVEKATQDSLFPLQGALGYEIHQTLYIGPNCLIVEGVSDKIYIETMSGILQRKNEEGLSPQWVITPTGGSSKVATFVSLVGSQKDMNLAVLIDFHKKDEQEIENLWKSKLMRKNKVYTYENFVPGDEADVEDMFNIGFYIDLVNGEYGSSIKESELKEVHPRITFRIESHLQLTPFPHNAKYNHYRPARYFQESVSTLESKLSEPILDQWRKMFRCLNALVSN
ncbi:MAG: AAA family ATPase [Caldilineaceae bacterium]|nr:AAA family ATPase [Caldilineaceae bacterium]